MKETLLFIFLFCIGAATHAEEVAVSTTTGSANPEREGALAQFYSILPTYSAQRDYAKFVEIRGRGAFAGTFSEYMEERFLRQKKAGIIMVAVGGVLTASSGALAGVLASMPKCEYQEAPSCYFSGEEVTMLTFSIVFAVSSAVLYGVGIPKLLLGKSRTEKMRQLRGTGDARRSGIDHWRLSFVHVSRLNAYGLGAEFRF